MRNFIINRILILAVYLAIIVNPLLAQDKSSILTTIPTFASIVDEIGGDLVSTKSVASPQFNPHFIEPKPSDVLRLKRADLFIHAGLDLEAWRQPLVDASARAEVREGGTKQLDLSRTISLLNVPTRKLSRADGDIHLFGNPHYWLSPKNGGEIAKAIAQKLTEMRPSDKDKIQEQLLSFMERLSNKINDWHIAAKKVKGKRFIAYHDEWVYLTDFLGAEISHFIEPKPGIPPTPKHLEELINAIQTEGIKGIIQATYYPKNSAELLNSKTGAKLLLLCQNVGELPECSSYIDMLDYNITTITSLYPDK